MDDPIDCLVVGGGPAGLTAAIYLVRFHLSVRLIDAGKSRLAWIPRTHNHAGYPGGISGVDLLERMREQAREFGVKVERGIVEHVEREDELFVARTVTGDIARARTLLLTTGIVNRSPPISPELHDVALARGLIRYCPICDGFEVTDKRVGVIGDGSHGCKEAVFLRSYTPDLTLIAPHGPLDAPEAERCQASEIGIRLVDGPCEPLRIDGDRIIVPTPEGDLEFDSVYPALGSVIRSELAVALGADASPDGCLVVDDHQRTSLAGLYAAGDVVKGLNQISHAMGEGGVAATTIRNDLAAAAPFLR
jgi:thioredoxin reductase (NADPH)